MEIRKTDGTWLALAGAILYLLEFAVIVPLGVAFPADPGSDLVSWYAGKETAYALTAALLSILLLGRVAVIAGIRGSLPSTGSVGPLGDLALAAMTTSVVVELVALWSGAGAAHLAGAGSETAGIAALDAAAGWLTVAVFVTMGVAVGVASLAMLLSHAFRAWLGWLGAISGLALAGSAIAALAVGETPWTIGGVAAIGQFGWLGMVIWMFGAGVILFRRSRASAVPGAEVRRGPSA